MNKLYLLLSLAALIGLSSCSSLRIEKRHYNKGWYVDFGTTKSPNADVDHADQHNSTEIAEETTSPAETTPAAAFISTGDAGTTTQLPPYNADETTTVTVLPAENSGDETAQPAETQNDQTPAVDPGNDRPSPDAPGERPGTDLEPIVLIIIAIFIPPLAVYLVQGVSTMFWITLICWLIGGAFLFGRFGYTYFGVLGLLAIILAILVVLGKI